MIKFILKLPLMAVILILKVALKMMGYTILPMIDGKVFVGGHKTTRVSK